MMNRTLTSGVHKSEEELREMAQELARGYYDEELRVLKGQIKTWARDSQLRMCSALLQAVPPSNFTDLLHGLGLDEAMMDMSGSEPEGSSRLAGALNTSASDQDAIIEDDDGSSIGPEDAVGPLTSNPSNPSAQSSRATPDEEAYDNDDYEDDDDADDEDEQFDEYEEDSEDGSQDGQATATSAPASTVRAGEADGQDSASSEANDFEEASATDSMESETAVATLPTAGTCSATADAAVKAEDTSDGGYSQDGGKENDEADGEEKAASVHAAELRDDGQSVAMTAAESASAVPDDASDIYGPADAIIAGITSSLGDAAGQPTAASLPDKQPSVAAESGAAEERTAAANHGSASSSSAAAAEQATSSRRGAVEQAERKPSNDMQPQPATDGSAEQSASVTGTVSQQPVAEEALQAQLAAAAEEIQALRARCSSLEEERAAPPDAASFPPIEVSGQDHERVASTLRSELLEARTTLRNEEEARSKAEELLAKRSEELVATRAKQQTEPPTAPSEKMLEQEAASDSEREKLAELRDQLERLLKEKNSHEAEALATKAQLMQQAQAHQVSLSGLQRELQASVLSCAVAGAKKRAGFELHARKAEAREGARVAALEADFERKHRQLEGNLAESAAAHQTAGERHHHFQQEVSRMEARELEAKQKLEAAQVEAASEVAALRAEVQQQARETQRAEDAEAYEAKLTSMQKELRSSVLTGVMEGAKRRAALQHQRISLEEREKQKLLELEERCNAQHRNLQGELDEHRRAAEGASQRHHTLHTELQQSMEALTKANSDVERLRNNEGSQTAAMRATLVSEESAAAAARAGQEQARRRCTAAETQLHKEVQAKNQIQEARKADAEALANALRELEQLKSLGYLVSEDVPKDGAAPTLPGVDGSRTAVGESSGQGRRTIGMDPKEQLREAVRGRGEAQKLVKQLQKELKAVQETIKEHGQQMAAEQRQIQLIKADHAKSSLEEARAYRKLELEMDKADSCTMMDFLRVGLEEVTFQDRPQRAQDLFMELHKAERSLHAELVLEMESHRKAEALVEQLKLAEQKQSEQLEAEQALHDAALKSIENLKVEIEESAQQRLEEAERLAELERQLVLRMKTVALQSEATRAELKGQANKAMDLFRFQEKETKDLQAQLESMAASQQRAKQELLEAFAHINNEHRMTFAQAEMMEARVRAWDPLQQASFLRKSAPSRTATPPSNSVAGEKPACHGAMASNRHGGEVFRRVTPADRRRLRAVRGSAAELHRPASQPTLSGARPCSRGVMADPLAQKGAQVGLGRTSSNISLTNLPHVQDVPRSTACSAGRAATAEGGPRGGPRTKGSWISSVAKHDLQSMKLVEA